MGRETVSVVFTDWVGSTGLASRVGPTAAERLRGEFYGVMREAVAHHSGREVKSTGDGLMIVFPSTASAVEAAVRMQQRLARRNRAAAEQLSMRIGVSLGDAEYAEGDYYGTAVVEAARLCDQAAGGQILATEPVYATAGVRGEHAFAPAGERELKGIPGPSPTFEVAWEQLADTADVPLPGRLTAVTPIAYVGRESEREHLARLADEAVAGQRRVALLCGEPGIGKTRLATHVAIDVHGRGVNVLYGRCDSDVALPYAPWAEAIQHYVKHGAQEVLEEHVEAHGGELARLAPQLLRRVPATPAPRESDPETERYLLWGAVAGLLEAASAHSPLIVVLDDLHWADRPTLTLLKYVLGVDSSMAALLLGTYRDSDIASDHPLAELLADLRRETDVARINLAGLAHRDVVAMMEAAAGHGLGGGGAALADEIIAETDGNPFYVAELLRHLYESGAISQGSDGRWTLERPAAGLGLPQSVREVVGRRVERLGPEASKVLAVAAVIGREFDVELLARVTRSDPDTLLDLLDDAVAASVLVESADTTGRFVFAHALVTHTLYEGLGRTRRARVHQRVAEALEELCGSDPDSRAGELARHWANAGEPVDAMKAVRYAHRAGRLALDELAPDEALRWLEQARELQAQHADTPVADRCDLLIDLGEAQQQAGDPAFRETLLEAVALARELSDPHRLAAAALANTRALGSSAFGKVDGERVAALEAALDSAPPGEDAMRAQLLVKLAVELNWGGDLARRERLVDEALAVARRCGDDRTLAMVLTDGSLTTWVPWMLEQRRVRVRELAEVAERLGDPVVQARAAWIAAKVAIESADRDAAARCNARAQEIAESLGQPTLRWHVDYQRGALALLEGDFGRAEQLAGEAAQLGLAYGQPDAPMVYGTQILNVRWLQGRVSELIELVEQATRDNPGISSFAAAVAQVYAAAGRAKEATEIVEAAAAAGFRDIPEDQAWAPTMAAYALAITDLRHREAAAILLPVIEPHGDQIVQTSTITYGAIAHYCGLLARTLGLHAQAQRHFARAAELNERVGAPVFLARTQLAWALSLIEDGGDQGQARALLEAAEKTAAQFGAAALERRASELRTGESRPDSVPELR